MTTALIIVAAVFFAAGLGTGLALLADTSDGEDS